LSLARCTAGHPIEKFKRLIPRFEVDQVYQSSHSHCVSTPNLEIMPRSLLTINKDCGISILIDALSTGADDTAMRSEDLSASAARQLGASLVNVWAQNTFDIAA
jgi:hypothetical protein